MDTFLFACLFVYAFGVINLFCYVTLLLFHTIVLLGESSNDYGPFLTSSKTRICSVMTPHHSY